MKIGELSLATSTPVETIRYYEKQGLLLAPARTEGNFRVYDDAHQDRLQFIRYCRGLDMSLDEVRILLDFKDRPPEDCTDVNALIEEHIDHVTTRIKELRSLEKQLKDLRYQCPVARRGDECGILNELFAASSRRGVYASEPTHVRGAHGKRASG